MCVVYLPINVCVSVSLCLSILSLMHALGSYGSTIHHRIPALPLVGVCDPAPHPTPSHQRVLLPVIGRSQDHSGALMAEEFKACLISLGYDVENNKQVGLSTTTQRGSARCLG